MRRLAQCVVAGTVTAVVLLSGAGAGFAVPPPPPNPSDGQIQAGQGAADAKAAQVGALANQLAGAETQLQQLADQVELKMEDANKAQVDQQAAQRAADAAQNDADAARADADAATRSVTEARARLADFAARSYEQGSMVGSLSAFIGARNPQDMLDRAQLLDAVGKNQLTGLDTLERAQTAQANKDSVARAALQAAQAKRSAADQASQAATRAKTDAVAAQQGQAAQTQRLQDAKSTVEQQLTAAQSAVAGLRDQRQQYQSWVAEQQREEAAAQAAAQAAAAAAQHSAAQQSSHASGHVASAAGGGAQAVVARALSELGVPYSWGGGNEYGATVGIRDGGVADSYGDYHKVGFDCSGLMVYSFAAAGISLPHYSGYQYEAGRHVPLAGIEPGDMLFWADGSDIHHVALYIGGGRMVEAPYSGSYVRVVPVRYYDGIMPYATRMF